MERKSHALVSLEHILELWKQLFQFCMSSSSTQLERSMKNLSTESQEYDPYVARRSMLITLVSYLLPVWTHELVYSLPSTISKVLFDLVQLAIKSIQDVHQLPLLSSATKIDANASLAKKSSMTSGQSLLRGDTPHVSSTSGKSFFQFCYWPVLVSIRDAMMRYSFTLFNYIFHCIINLFLKLLIRHTTSA